MADEEFAPISNNVTNWNVDLEVSLFHAMHDHKPVGVNRHFQMVFIHDKLNSSVSKKIPSSEIWKHLSELYDLQALHESERIPFPNKEVDFSLPSGSFDDLMNCDFPRSGHTTLKAEPSTKDGVTNVTSKEVTETKPPGSIAKSSKGSVQPANDESASINEKPTEPHKTEESMKTDRKRTRHSIQHTAGDSTPASTTASSTKRVRRT